jgi:HD-GYP domain-containing protein (c-di-GMP phosphodiesterase class II)
MPAAAGERVRRAEIVMALSHATDLAIGQPVEYALRSCVLAMQLATRLGVDASTRSEVFHHALLRYVGCNAETDAMAALFGDEIAFRRKAAMLDMGDPSQLGPALLGAITRAQSGQRPSVAIFRILRGLATSRAFTVEGFRAHCETAQELARRLGFDGAIVRNLGQFQERWDGRGLPSGLRGESIALAVRIVALAHDVIVLDAASGRARTREIVRQRCGALYDPRVVDAFLASADSIDDAPSWDTVLALEPTPHAMLDDAGLDEALLAMADFVDLKSPYTTGHSRAVAILAASAGRLAGLSPSDVTTLRRAALVHDIGQVAISSGVLARTTALGEADREALRLHPYHAERILARPPTLARLAAIVGRHHERIDGSGYHRGARESELAMPAKILAAAEVYRALIEARPHRPARLEREAATVLREEVRAGHLDAEAVRAVLEAAGHRVPQGRRERVGGLSARELDVLRQIARGRTTREIATALGIAPKTADNHVQNLYAKIGVSTRAAATLYAVHHGLLED